MMTADATTSNAGAWLAQMPFTLALSGGFFGFFAHTGVLIALRDAGLTPARVVGVSSGALAGGLFAGGVSPTTLADTFLRIRRADFWDRAFPYFGLLPGRRFDALIRKILAPHQTERHEDCPIPFASVVCDLRLRPRAIESGPINTSIRASCAIPPLFRPVRHEGRALVDGGLKDRLGEVAFSATERVLLHVLPHRPGPSGKRPPLAAVPAASGRRVLHIPELPAISPSDLSMGRAAIERARSETERWLSAG